MAHFDSHRMFGRMREAGTSAALAEAVSDEVRQAVAPMDQLVTRADLSEQLHALTWRLVQLGVALTAIGVAVVAGIVAALA